MIDNVIRDNVKKDNVKRDNVIKDNVIRVSVKQDNNVRDMTSWGSASPEKKM